MTEVIELKCWSISFQAIKRGEKRFEYRKNDRPYAVGVTLYQREWNPDTEYTGDELYHDIEFIIFGGVFGIPEGYCIMSMTEPRSDCSCPAESEREKVLKEVRENYVKYIDIPCPELAKKYDHLCDAEYCGLCILDFVLAELRSKQGGKR